MKYNKLNMFYLALTEKECCRLPLNFLSNGLAGVRENEPWTRTQVVCYTAVISVGCEADYYSSVNLLQQLFKQWNAHLDKQTLGITRNYLGY